MLTKYSLDLRLARDLQLGREAKEPQRPSIEGVLSLREEKRREEKRKEEKRREKQDLLVISTQTGL